MAYLHTDLHAHRSPMTPEDHRELLPQAAEIARTRMEAFAVPCEIDTTGPTLEIWTNPGTPAADLLNFPKPSGLGLSFQHKRAPGWFASYAAAVETALAWQQAGLIHHFCDLFRWDRHPDWNPYLTTPEDRDQIVRGLVNLGIPQDQKEHQWFPQLHPDPDATKLARELAEHLGSSNAAVLLIGSRARGDNQENSDIDLLLELGEGVHGTAWEAMHLQVKDFLETAEAAFAAEGREIEADAYMVESWERQRWQHHSEKLSPMAPNGLAFTTNPDLLEQAPVSCPDHPEIDGGRPFYFLTAGAGVTEVFSGNWCTKDALDLQRCK